MNQGFSHHFSLPGSPLSQRLSFPFGVGGFCPLRGRSQGDVRSGAVPSVLCVTSRFFPPGGGITERNLQRILEGSAASEFHCSARSARDSGMKFR